MTTRIKGLLRNVMGLLLSESRRHLTLLMGLSLNARMFLLRITNFLLLLRGKILLNLLLLL